MEEIVSRETFFVNKTTFNEMYDLQKLLSSVGIYIDDKQREFFQKYIDLLLIWNKRTNLISRKDESRVIEKHILESLSFMLSFKIQPSAKIIDIGSGAGFPGLPISLICPDSNFVLVESKRLKALFLKEVVAQLQLNNVEVFCERVENLTKNMKYKGQFDFVFSRAVASLREVYDWIQDLIKPNGFYIAWKGGDILQEVEDLKRIFKNIIINIVEMDRQLISPDTRKVFVRIQRNISTMEE